MPSLPKLPKLGGFPKPPRISEIIKKANPVREVVEDARELIKTGREEIGDVASSLRVEEQKETSSEEKSTPTIQEPAKSAKTVATACVPCALGHFSTSAGLLNEIARFKGEGITSDEILDRVAKVQEEQNALERVDLTSENIQALPPWEKELAEDALSQSRKLRHSLESFTSIKQLEQAAADTSSFYKDLNRKWFKGRFAHLGPEKAQRIADEVSRLSSEDKERIMKRAEELIVGA